MPTKKLKRPPMPGAGRPKSESSEKWVTINVTEKTKKKLQELKKDQTFNQFLENLLAKLS